MGKSKDKKSAMSALENMTFEVQALEFERMAKMYLGTNNKFAHLTYTGAEISANLEAHAAFLREQIKE